MKRVAAHALALITGASLLMACTPSHSTVGGLGPAQLAPLADRARQSCEQHRGTGNGPPAAFTTDGCSLWPDGTWQACCVEHDVVYWCGGPAARRQAADADLRACVLRSSSSTMATAMYWGVRAGGHPWWPVPWRWGYGWPWPRGYDP